jgi:hypothetical protein
MKRSNKRIRNSTAANSSSRSAASRAPNNVLRRVVTWLSAVFALVAAAASGGYIMEKWNEARATITMSQEIDQKKPFSSPLLISNRSTILMMWNVRVRCEIDAEFRYENEGRVTEKGWQWATADGNNIPPSGSTNFNCNFPDKFTIRHGVGSGAPPMSLSTSANKVNLTYDNYLLFLKVPQQVTENFTLINTSVGYRWLKGSFLNPP